MTCSHHSQAAGWCVVTEEEEPGPSRELGSGLRATAFFCSFIPSAHIPRGSAACWPMGAGPSVVTETPISCPGTRGQMGGINRCTRRPHTVAVLSQDAREGLLEGVIPEQMMGQAPPEVCGVGGRVRRGPHTAAGDVPTGRL